jgi:glutaredoxin domain-containing cysteine-rich protein 1
MLEPAAPDSRRTQTADTELAAPDSGRLTFVRGTTTPPTDSRSSLVEPAPQLPTAPVAVAETATEESIVRSRTGTVVGRKGTVGNLRERFQRRGPGGSGSTAQATPPPPAKSRRESGNGAMIESEEAFASRRGSVLLKKGVVGQWKNIFHRKAHDLVTPKTLAEELAEREQALGAKLGGCLVVYTSSTTMVRETYADCQVRNLPVHARARQRAAA